MSSSPDNLIPIEEKTLDFYEDQLIAVRLSNGAIYVPVRPLCDNLVWSGPGSMSASSEMRCSATGC